MIIAIKDDIPLRDVEDGFELELTFDGEVLDGEVVFPVVAETLVERSVLFGSDVAGVAGPDGLHLVELLVLNCLLLDLLGLLLLLFILVNLFDLRLLAVLLRLLFLLIIFNLL